MHVAVFYGTDTRGASMHMMQRRPVVVFGGEYLVFSNKKIRRLLRVWGSSEGMLADSQQMGLAALQL